MTLTFSTKTIGLITFFENLTGTSVKDCVVDDAKNSIYFVVDEGKLGIAIGKNGCNVKAAEERTGKTIKLFEFSNDLAVFVKRIIPQAMSVKIREENGQTIVEIEVEKKDRGIVFGRDRNNLKIHKQLLQRSHGINDLIVR